MIARITKHAERAKCLSAVTLCARVVIVRTHRSVTLQRDAEKPWFRLRRVF
ncbi:MAG: hypothetical protein JWN13_6977 [Betaproteobacteria bacterium]|nr:hypothetical protein [Betaproteobacteria bacterium]